MVGRPLRRGGGTAQRSRPEVASHPTAWRVVFASRVDAVSTRIVNAVRSQGEAVTDKVADAVKERLFSSRPAQPAASEPVSVPATIRTTS